MRPYTTLRKLIRFYKAKECFVAEAKIENQGHRDFEAPFILHIAYLFICAEAGTLTSRWRCRENIKSRPQANLSRYKYARSRTSDFRIHREEKV